MRFAALPRILIAEPLADQRDLYADYFRWAGFQVVTAASGQETLDRAAATPPDIISACFDLADLDGPALCSALRSRPGTARVPVILLATRVSPADIGRATAAGCAEILLKPVLPEQLLEEARKHVRRSRLMFALSERVKQRAARARVRAADATQNAESLLRRLGRRRKRR